MLLKKKLAKKMEITLAASNFLSNQSHNLSMIIPPAPPPPLQIAAQPLWPGFNVCTKWTIMRAPDILQVCCEIFFFF